MNEARPINPDLTSIRLHNEPLAGALALGGLCSCPICQPELYPVDEGGEA